GCKPQNNTTDKSTIINSWADFIATLQLSGMTYALASNCTLKSAEKNQIDPVLLASIAFHETGKGSSKMVRERNNPGGLYNSKAGTFFVYDSLDSGIDAMASNLYRLYISQGLFTIEQIGAKYAPIGVANDPTNLNIHWVPNVSKVIAQFGGMISNCSTIGFESGFISPMAVMNITSRYGFRINPVDGEAKLHAGIDFDCSLGTPIVAAMSGTVTRSAFMGHGWGNYIKIQHGDKSTLYAHMTHRLLSVGDQVEQGQQIGACGDTGKSTGPHLHLELYVGSSTVDPYQYFSNAGGK
ncbi:MAG: peptidoglycan DD-metalloendopeptidase family protein, partial [Carnobacterium alterfunditum]